MRRVLLALVVWLLIVGYGASLRAQAVPEVKPEPGYATGHVVCADSQRPARMALVRFVPVPSTTKAATEQTSPKSKDRWMQLNELQGSEINPVETDIDGSYTVRNLKPGFYIVRVDLGGYLTPLLSMSQEDLQHPDEAARQRISRELQIVEIRSRAETRADVTLQRGATISGTVRFDDGSPAIGINTEVLVKNAKGEWESATLGALRFGATDAQGRYDLEGVPPGEYIIRANLSLSEFSNSVMPMNGNEVHVTMSKTYFALPVYTGSVLRKRDAAVIKVDAAVNFDNNDITLPVSKLHRVSGAVLVNGHPVNGGKVVLRFADDNTELASTDISRDDRQFHFPYVPEGSYTLAVEEAREVTPVEVANPPGMTPKTHTEDRTLRTYGKAEQSLVVESDMEGVMASVPEQQRSGPSVAQQAN